MGKVRVKQDEDTTYVEGMMGTLAEDLGALLGIKLVVLRTKEEFHGKYGPPQIKYYYQIHASHADHDMTFGRTSNPNEIKRSLAMVTDMVHMGFVEAKSNG